MIALIPKPPPPLPRLLSRYILVGWHEIDILVKVIRVGKVPPPSMREARRKAQAGGSPTSLAEFPPERQEEIRERVKHLSGMEREVELQLIAAENRAMHEYVEQVEKSLEDEKRRRDERRERGRETVGDTIKRLWGFGNR